MKLPVFDEPRLYVVRGDELTLSGQALLEIMQDVLAKKMPFRFRARGLSMSPFIKDCDVITLVPLSSMRIRLGEIIAFRCPQTDKPVVHRVVARSSDGVVMQGDSIHRHRDGFVPLANLLGRVIRIERKGKNLHLGLGPERQLIAVLSRINWLVPMRMGLATVLSPFRRRDR